MFNLKLLSQLCSVRWDISQYLFWLKRPLNWKYVFAEEDSEALRTERSLLCVRLMSGSWCLEAACSVYSPAGKLWLMHTSRVKLSSSSSSSSCCLVPFFVLEMWNVLCSITVYAVALVSLAFLQPRERLESKAGKLALKKSCLKKDMSALFLVHLFYFCATHS